MARRDAINSFRRHCKLNTLRHPPPKNPSGPEPKTRSRPRRIFASALALVGAGPRLGLSQSIDAREGGKERRGWDGRGGTKRE